MKKIVENKYAICIFAVFVVLMIGVLSKKEDFHIDEYYSYGLANSPNGLGMAVDWGIEYERDGLNRLFVNYLAVWEDEIFDYKTVWANQSDDVHPPLYYAVLHTISSLFPGKFSIWFAGSINIIFALLTLGVLRKLANAIFQVPFLTNLISIVFALSAEVLSATSFFRMYIMAMFFVTLTTYYFVELVEKQELSWKEYFCLFALSVSGALTHYYYVVYLVFICVVYGIWLLVKKQWKNLIVFVGTMIASAFSAIVIFPAMLEHVFSGYRGAETMENFANSSLSDYGRRLSFFYKIFNERLFGGMLSWVVIGLVVFVLAMQLKNSKWIKGELQQIAKNETIIIKGLLIVVPTIFYYFIIAKVTIDNGSERYMVPIYAIAMLMFMGAVYYVTKRLVEGNVAKVFLCVFSVIVIVNGWMTASWPHLYIGALANREVISDYAEADAVVIYDHIYKVHMSYPELSKYNSVTFMVDYNDYWISDWDCVQGEELVLVLVGLKEDEVQKILTYCPFMNDYEIISNYGYCTTYRLY